MIDYEKLYYELYGKMSDSIEVLDALSALLKQVQLGMEERVVKEN